MVGAPGRCASSTTITANTIDARPRGPNQPRNPTVWRWAPLPTSAMATGSMRTTVRLSTAYSATRQVTCSSAGPRRTAPNARKVTPPSRPPISSSSRAPAHPAEQPAGHERGDDPGAAERRGHPVGQRGARHRDDLEPRAGDQIPADPERDHAGGRQPGRGPTQKPVADLLGHDAEGVSATGRLG